MSIFDAFLSAPETLDAFGDRAVVAAMLRFEAALARAQAAEGLIPETSADAIVAACDVGRFDVAGIVRDSGRAGTVAIPLVKALREAVVALSIGWTTTRRGSSTWSSRSAGSAR